VGNRKEFFVTGWDLGPRSPSKATCDAETPAISYFIKGLSPKG
jgi:hypothetical protein